jgi:hypothetical protein
MASVGLGRPNLLLNQPDDGAEASFHNCSCISGEDGLLGSWDLEEKSVLDKGPAQSSVQIETKHRSQARPLGRSQSQLLEIHNGKLRDERLVEKLPAERHGGHHPHCAELDGGVSLQPVVHPHQRDAKARSSGRGSLVPWVRPLTEEQLEQWLEGHPFVESLHSGRWPERKPSKRHGRPHMLQHALGVVQPRQW